MELVGIRRPSVDRREENTLQPMLRIDSQMQAEFQNKIDRTDRKQLIQAIAFVWGSDKYGDIFKIKELEESIGEHKSDYPKLNTQFRNWIICKLWNQLDPVDKEAYFATINDAIKERRDIKQAVLDWVKKSDGEY